MVKSRDTRKSNKKAAAKSKKEKKEEQEEKAGGKSPLGGILGKILGGKQLKGLLPIILGLLKNLFKRKS